MHFHELGIAAFIVGMIGSSHAAQKTDQKPPQKQQEILHALLRYEKELNEASKLPNKLAVEEARRQASKSLSEWLKVFNKETQKDGIQDWVGTVTLGKNRLFLWCWDKKIRIELLSVHLRTEIKESIKSMKDGEAVVFTFTPPQTWGRTTPRVITFAPSPKGNFEALAFGAYLTELKKLTRE